MLVSEKIHYKLDLTEYKEISQIEPNIILISQSFAQPLEIYKIMQFPFRKKNIWE